MGLVNEGLNLIVCPLWKRAQAKASEQVQLIPSDRLPAGRLRSGNAFHPVLFRLMIMNDRFYKVLFWGEISEDLREKTKQNRKLRLSLFKLNCSHP